MSIQPQKIVTRLINKHDLEVNWQNNLSFAPLQGELIIYDREVDVDGNILELPSNRVVPYTYERFKIGDGSTLVNDLPFVDEHIISKVNDKLDAKALPDAINEALTQAKASGEFDGEDGVSVTHLWNGTTLTVISASGTSSANLKGDKGDQGIQGPKGDSPVRGTDYWTDADKTEIKSYIDDAILNGAW